MTGENGLERLDVVEGLLIEADVQLAGAKRQVADAKFVCQPGVCQVVGIAVAEPGAMRLHVRQEIGERDRLADVQLAEVEGDPERTTQETAEAQTPLRLHESG